MDTLEGIESRPRVVLVARAAVIKKDRILLIQRSIKDRHNPGMYEFPGGKLEAGKTIEGTLNEEIYEETRIFCDRIGQTFYIENKINVGGSYPGLLYVAMIGIARWQTGGVRLSSEHDNFAWTSLRGASRFQLTTETDRALTYLGPQIREQLHLR